MNYLDMYLINLLYGDTGSQSSSTIVQNNLENWKTVDDIQQTIKSGALERYLDSLPDKLLELGIRVLFSIIVVFVGLKLINFIRKIIRKSFERHDVEKGVIQFTDGLIRALLTIFLIFWVAVNFGVQATSIAALISSISIAIGLALQGSLSNFAGGILILILKPFKVGDYIKEDTYQNEGTVMEISLFYTKLLSYDNKTIVLPNGTLANTSMANYSRDGKRRIDLKLGISYEADIKQAREVIMDILNKSDKVYQNMQKIVFVRELGDNGVILGVRCFVNAGEYFPVYWELLEEIKYAFDKNDIGIPFPQMDVHLESRESNIH